MIEVVNPGMHAVIVDRGRFGYSAIGVPVSSALDQFACKTLNRLTGSDDSAAVIEVIGAYFSVRFQVDTTFAITGARVSATLNNQNIRPWTAVNASRGSVLKVTNVTEGFRYYVGFAGGIDIEPIMGSRTTNLECRFGGYQGRALKAGDKLRPAGSPVADPGMVPEHFIPRMHPPHRLRMVAGPEADFFTDDSMKRFVEKRLKTVYTVSVNSNRAGIRLEGDPLIFKDSRDKSIVSEGIMPGTVQIPGDGMPIIILYERTIGGYARVATVVMADQDALAHLKPADDAWFEMIGLEEAEALWKEKSDKMEELNHYLRRSA
jgi:antagonist of KipI